jgi:CheY-like chemotaxis protein
MLMAQSQRRSRNNRPEILIVDDNEDDLMLCRRALEKKDYRTHGEDSGPKAIEYVRKHPDVGLVILDIRMMPLTGLETMDLLRQVNKELSIVLFSNHPDYRRNFRTWAADAYLLKKVDFTELIETVDRLLASG